MNANEMIDKLLAEGKISEEQAKTLRSELEEEVEETPYTEIHINDDEDCEVDDDEDEEDDDDEDEDEDDNEYDDEDNDNIIVDLNTEDLEKRINNFGKKMGKLGSRMGKLGEQLGKKYAKIYDDSMQEINHAFGGSAGKCSFTIKNNGCSEKKIPAKSNTPYDKQTVTLSYYNGSRSLKYETNVAELIDCPDKLNALDTDFHDIVNQLLTEQFTGLYKKMDVDRMLKVEIY